MTDHETRVAEALAEYMASKDGPEYIRVGLWVKYLDLHKGRTPERVAEMEAEQGLS